MLTKSASRKAKIVLDSQQIIALHVDLVTTAFKDLPVQILPSGSVEINQSATIEDFKSILRFAQQESTIGTTFRFYLEGDMWNQIQERLGRRNGLKFLISIFGDELGRRMQWRLRSRGRIAKLVPIYERDYTMTQRQIIQMVSPESAYHSDPFINTGEFVISETGQVTFEFDFKGSHHSIKPETESVTRLVQFVSANTL